MYLRIGGRLRPFNEATVSISYEPVYDLKKQMIEVVERWDISGRVIQQTNATQSGMTTKLAQLEQDFNQFRPDLVFLEDDGATPSHYKLLRSECVDGPRIIGANFPGTGADVYPTGQPYNITFVGTRTVASSSGVLLEFSEVLSEDDGGEKFGFVGGAINNPELQRFRQNAAWLYTQSGSAVGLYGYPVVPGPIFPGFQLEPSRLIKVSPRIHAPVAKEFEIRWTYKFGSINRLSGEPHRVI